MVAARPYAPTAFRVAVERRVALGGVAFASYLAASVGVFGRGVIAEPASRVVGDAGADKTIFMWSFRWWPHALMEGHDPFAAGVVWVPHGIDLAWVTSSPLLSVLFAPVTAAFGPVVAYNVAILVAPALSGWAAYLLARYLTKAFWPSLLCGWLFGFSAYELGHMVGHLNLVFLPFVPLAALLVLKHLNGQLGHRRFVVLLAATMLAQLLVSAEILVDVLLVAALFFGSTTLFAPERRRAVAATASCAASAAFACAIVAAPYLWHAFRSVAAAPVRSPFSEAADLLNYVVPTRRFALQPPPAAAIADHFTAVGAERGAYLGVPLLVLAVLWFRSGGRRATAMAAGAGLLTVAVASLGSWVHVAGHAVLPTPWLLLARLPITSALLPGRLVLFVALGVGVIAALWLSNPPVARWRWGLALLGVVVLLPNAGGRLWASDVPNPAFFRTPTYSRYVRAGQTLLILPFGGAGWSLLWQAEDGFEYQLVGGHLGHKVTPAEKVWTDVYRALSGARPVSALRFRRFLRAHGVAWIVAAPGASPASLRLVQRLALRGTRTAGVILYQV